MLEPSTILLAIGDPTEWAPVISELKEEGGYRVLIASSLKEARGLADSADIDLVICEATLDGSEGAELLSEFRVLHPDVVRILVKSGNGTQKRHAQAVRASVYQYIRKPLDHEQIGLLAKRALETRELSRRHRLLSREIKFHDDAAIIGRSVPHHNGVKSHNFEKLVYASEQMAELCNLARQAAPTDLPILIQGETGTGKELFARALHFRSDRNQSPLLFQNCGGMSDELLQSELFGHKRGSFTGAVGDRMGLFRAADGGTVFLDEISSVSPSFQVSLLRFLANGEIKPLGSDTTQTCNVRILAASNQPLEELVKAGKFRQDLYFRLKGFEIKVPPLRARREDITVLAEFFVRKFSESMGRRVLGITNDVLKRFAHYDFPGNVRELENEIRRMVALAKDGEYITHRNLSPEIASINPDRENGNSSLLQFKGDSLKEKVESLEKGLVIEALKRHRWNQSETARELGLSRVGLSNKIKRYHLERTN